MGGSGLIPLSCQFGSGNTRVSNVMALTVRPDVPDPPLGLEFSDELSAAFMAWP